MNNKRLSHGQEWDMVMKGRLAFQEGEGVADCPYEDGNPRRVPWLAGWHQAYERALIRRDRGTERAVAYNRWRGQNV